MLRQCGNGLVCLKQQELLMPPVGSFYSVTNQKRLKATVKAKARESAGSGSLVSR